MRILKKKKNVCSIIITINNHHKETTFLTTLIIKKKTLKSVNGNSISCTVRPVDYAKCSDENQYILLHLARDCFFSYFLFLFSFNCFMYIYCYYKFGETEVFVHTGVLLQVI